MAKLTIDLNPEEQKELVEFYTNKVDSLLKKINDIKELLEKLTGKKIEINETYNEIVQDVSADIKKTLPDDYNSWSIPERIRYALNQNNKCLTTRQIVEYLNRFESIKKSSFYGTVSGVISNKIQKKILFNRYTPYKGKEYYIGLIEWWDNEGNLSEQYKVK